MNITSLISKAWLIYYCIIAATTILLLSNINSKYDELLTKRKHDQLYITKIVKADINTLLSKYETMIDLVNEDFKEDNILNQHILQNILQKSDLLMGFIIFNLDGTLLTKSNNLPDKAYEINSDLYFDKSFADSLYKDNLMIGKAIFSPVTKKWIIPIRKTLFNKAGLANGFITSAINLEKLKQKWLRSQAFGNTITLMFDQNFYPFLHTGITTDNYQKFYATPLTNDQLTNTEEQLKKQNITLDMLRNTGEVAQLIFTVEGNKVLHSLTYNKEYQFWTRSSRPLSDVITPLAYAAGYCLALYSIFLLVVFFLFKWIIRIEESKLVTLTYKTEHDDLTDCYNRSVLEPLMKQLSKAQIRFSMLYIDLDNFKNINDSFGHNYGDALLQAVSLRIKKSLTNMPSHLIRYSGDKFIVLIEKDNENVVRNFAAGLLNHLAKLHCINNHSFSVTSSIGIARYPSDAKNLDTLISYAENSMEIAKKTKNHYLFFSQEVHQLLLKQGEIEQALRYAIDAGEISIVYQPQVDNENNLYGVEALVRWHSALLGTIPPDIFIPIAEKTGLMPELGQYIMNKAMHEIASLQRSSKTTFALSINVSVRQFVQVNFFEKLTKSIQYFGEKNLPITIEITESLFIESLEVLLPIFCKMKANNISLALDDFGTGYSSLSMLRDAPIDELKIDKSFVDHISANKTDRAMVKSIISMGKNLNMRVLAEGVETSEQANILADNGCDLLQGYYFSKPLPIKELTDFVKMQPGKIQSKIYANKSHTKCSL